MSNPITRRGFLLDSFKVILAGTAALGSLAALQAIESSADSAPPYGPLERTQTLDYWTGQIDQTIVALERLWSFLVEARALPPAGVDGRKLLDLENQAMDLMDSLEIETRKAGFDAVYRAATGYSSFFWAVAADIRLGANPQTIQAYIDDFGKDYPAQASELQAMLDSVPNGYARREVAL